MDKIAFFPFPTLTTERLILRRIEMDDADVIFEHRDDDEVNRYLEGFRHSGIADTRRFIERMYEEVAHGNTIIWVITEKGDDTFLGTVCLWNISTRERKAEAGYTLRTGFHKKGYMTEALAEAVTFGFNVIGLDMIDAFTHPENEASMKVLRRNGFRPTGIVQLENSGKRVLFELARKEYQQECTS